MIFIGTKEADLRAEVVGSFRDLVPPIFVIS